MWREAVEAHDVTPSRTALSMANVLSKSPMIQAGSGHVGFAFGLRETVPLYGRN